jgi:3-oxoacyl-[acyl-carrier-protein] synthase-1
MVTGVGLSAPAACAAIRVGLNNFAETKFIDKGGEWMIGSAVPTDEPWRGREKLIRLVTASIGECLERAGRMVAQEVPVLLCVAETGRPGRLDGLDETVLREIENRLEIRFHKRSEVIAGGCVAGVEALHRTRALVRSGRPYCLIAGVDSYLVAATLAAYEERNRLKTSLNSDGFIPGEAGAAVLLGPPSEGQRELRCHGIGVATENATIEGDEPLRADGLVSALRACLADAGTTMAKVDYRITDLNGEQYSFKEAALALTRVLRERKDRMDLWHPADSIGDVGAATVPCVLGIALEAARKGYAPGSTALCHFANDGVERAALILSSDGAGL